MILPIRAPQIKRGKLFAFCLLDSFPEKQVHSPELAEPRVRATVLVNQGVLVVERQNARHWLIAFGNQANLQLVSHERDQVAEP
jgi:hypothetical protein